MKNLKIILTFFIITACAVGPDYKKPETKAPGFWSSLGSFFTVGLDVDIANQKSEKEWWKNFNDPILNALIDEAIANNLDFKIAESKVAEARSNITKETAALFPQVNASGSLSRSSKYFNPLAQTKRKPISLYQAGFDASWEIDLFGGVIRAEEAAKALFESSGEARNSALVSLTAEVAKNYMELRNIQNQIQFNQKIISNLEEIIRLESSRRDAGLISDIEVEKVNLEILDRKSTMLDLETSLNVAEFRIEVLLARQPGELKKLLKPQLMQFPNFNETIILKAPAQILENRPDIRKAERDLAVATALEGVAVSELYPKISLTGFFGFQNLKSGNLLKSASNAFSTGAGVNMPILNFGSVRANIKVFNARKEQAFLEYKSAILKALEDVENALTAYSNQFNKMKYLGSSMSSSQKISGLVEGKYNSGLISKTEFLRSKIDFYQTHIILMQNQTILNNNTIALYKSLGGSWKVANQENRK
jgi:NodT family efflux transporter outer membrane factor (OMF) lipoprotein